MVQMMMVSMKVPVMETSPCSTQESVLAAAAAPVLDALDFTFSPGQRIGLFGPNGSGKTTLLHIMMGLARPQSGVVRYKGREAQTERDFREVRLGIGMLLQNADDQIIYPTVLDDVAFGPLNRGLPPDAGGIFLFCQ